MSRSLDIAKILRATEIDNPTNARLITTPDDLGGGMDSAEVQGVGMLYVDTLDSLPLNNLQIGQSVVNTQHLNKPLKRLTFWKSGPSLINIQTITEA